MASGSHEHLMDSSDLYRRIYESQYGKEESHVQGTH